MNRIFFSSLIYSKFSRSSLKLTNKTSQINKKFYSNISKLTAEGISNPDIYNSNKF